LSTLTDDEVARIYQVLSSPVRQRIIEFLGVRGKASVTEIKRALKISTGSLYYNLDLLGDLVYRDVDKKFALTEKGWIAYNLIISGRESILDLKIFRNHIIPFKVRSRLSLILHPRWLFMTLAELRMLSILAVILVLAAGALICYYARVELTLYVYSFRPVQAPWITSLKFILSWIAIYGLANLLTFIIHGRTGGYLTLLGGLAIATIPLLICPLLSLMVPGFSENYQLLSAIMIAMQLLSCLLLSTAISVSKNMSIQRSLLIGFLILYLNLTIAVMFRS